VRSDRVAAPLNIFNAPAEVANSAMGMKVVMTDPSQIAAAGAGQGTGDNANAIAIANLANESLLQPTATSNFSLTQNLNPASGTATGSVTLYDAQGHSYNATVTYTNTAANTWSYNISVPETLTPATGASGQVSYSFGTGETVNAGTSLTIPGTTAGGTTATIAAPPFTYSTTSANNGTLNATDVRAIGNQIAGILGEVTSLANTGYQGQYIFAGGQTQTQPFTTSAGSTPETTTYNGDQDVNYIQTPNGQKIQLNVPGDQIFLGSGTNSVFAALNSLVADYASGTVNSTQAVADTTALNTSLNYVSQQRVTIDNSITQVTAATGAVTNNETQLKSAQTNLIQADLPTISTELAQSETQQTALEDVIAELNSPSNSLFTKMG
jgi:flagellar hook-associated protein 3 FlgL